MHSTCSSLFLFMTSHNAIFISRFACIAKQVRLQFISLVSSCVSNYLSYASFAIQQTLYTRIVRNKSRSLIKKCLLRWLCERLCACSMQHNSKKPNKELPWHYTQNSIIHIHVDPIHNSHNGVVDVRPTIRAKHFNEYY